ncbi:MAG TPA: thymidine phosphorylase [Candidatus Gastranaerophilaceae bacterium]|nr:thymidine phosphorylase [Candidatus Gastranaerophilaceae bacterium]HPT41770.1 thymidine phosphorylase [Candidatus Gastranaerophilaceae bacterium]
MRIVDLIEKKKKGLKHTQEEINFIISSMMDGSAPDYQISAWLMAICFQGMNEDETTWLTDAIVKSGETVDLKELAKDVVDKHSTGGVGDKVTLTLIPLLAACEIPVAKLSGKGLGHTGGTIDKLESIPGFNTNLTIENLIKQVKKIKVAIGGQTQNLTPADGKIYALRDVTATINSMPLVASSIVSKKVASGADNIILDVKYGCGSFNKTAQDAVELSELMVKVGKRLSKSLIAVITSMEEPLGRAIGNSIEVIESIEFLKGHTQGDLTDLTYEFGAIALIQVGKFDDEKKAKEYLQNVVKSGKALEKFRELIKAQGGNPEVVGDYSKFPQAKYKVEIKSGKEGFISKIDAYQIAYGCKLLGAGRERKTDDIDYSVGVYLNKKHGEFCKKGEVLYTIYSNDEAKTKLAQDVCDQAFELTSKTPKCQDLIYKIIK